MRKNRHLAIVTMSEYIGGPIEGDRVPASEASRIQHSRVRTGSTGPLCGVLPLPEDRCNSEKTDPTAGKEWKTRTSRV